MATNPLFNKFKHAGEQKLLEDCIIEAIKIFGVDTYYLPRTQTNFNGVYFQDDMSQFNTAYLIEMYPENIDGFSGRGASVTKFGWEIRDQITFICAKRIFENEVSSNQNEIIRPRAGDLIFFPLNDLIFEIKFVENKPAFFQLGDLPTFEMVCELFEYANEQFNTGIEEIDRIQLNYSIDGADYGLMTEDGKYLLTENGNYLVTQIRQENIDEFDPLADNKRFEDFIDENEVIDFDESDPFSEGGRF